MNPTAQIRPRAMRCLMAKQPTTARARANPAPPNAQHAATTARATGSASAAAVAVVIAEAVIAIECMATVLRILLMLRVLKAKASRQASLRMRSATTALRPPRAKHQAPQATPIAVLVKDLRMEMARVQVDGAAAAEVVTAEVVTAMSDANHAGNDALLALRVRHRMPMPFLTPPAHPLHRLRRVLRRRRPLRRAAHQLLTRPLNQSRSSVAGCTAARRVG